MKNIKIKLFCLSILVLNLIQLLCGFISYGADKEKEPVYDEIFEILEGGSFEEYINKINLSLEKTGLESIEEMCERLVRDEDYGFTGFIKELFSTLIIDLSEYKDIVLNLFLICFSGAVFSLVTEAFSKNNIGEYGFYTSYAMLFCVVLTGFFSACEIAVVFLKNTISFMKVAAPAFAMAVVCSGEKTYGVGVGQLLLILCAVAGLFFINLLINAIRFYLVLGMSNSMLAADKFSHLVDMLSKGIVWVMRTVFVFFCGLSILQKMFWPAFDSMKNRVVLKTMSVIPGVGTTMNAAGQTVLGAFMVLKGSIGTLAVLFLVSTSAIPVIKVLLYYLTFNLTAIIIEPICDKRMVKALKVAAGAAGMLTCLMLAMVGVFIITLAIATG